MRHSGLFYCSMPFDFIESESFCEDLEEDANQRTARNERNEVSNEFYGLFTTFIQFILPLLLYSLTTTLRKSWQCNYRRTGPTVVGVSRPQCVKYGPTTSLIKHKFVSCDIFCGSSEL